MTRWEEDVREDCCGWCPRLKRSAGGQDLATLR